MKSVRSISRRSFLARVGTLPLLGLAACTTSGEHEPYDPRREVDREEECNDGDSGRYRDEPGRGRTCTFGRTRRRPRRRSD